MNTLTQILQNYSDGIPVNVTVETKSVAVLCGGIALAGILIVVAKYLLK